MILVVEGISASGKTTWCTRHGGPHVIAEHGRLDGVPERASDPVAAAVFWAERNVDRWQAALAMEARAPWAVCDSDPLKLHYLWCLWQIDEASTNDWQTELDATRDTVAQGRIGFADAYIVGRIDPQLARQRARADSTRRRSNFELHVRLQQTLLTWYAAIEHVLPGSVHVGFPAKMPVAQPRNDRYPLAAFDRMIALLPGK